MEKHKSHVPNHQPVMVLALIKDALLALLVVLGLPLQPVSEGSGPIL